MRRGATPSRYRHVYGSPARSRDQCFERIVGGASSTLPGARAGHETSLLAVNRRFMALIVQSSGGGVFSVLPLHAVRTNDALFTIATVT